MDLLALAVGDLVEIAHDEFVLAVTQGVIGTKGWERHPKIRMHCSYGLLPPDKQIAYLSQLKRIGPEG